MTARHSVDQLAREARLKRSARVRMVREAFSSSAAVIITIRCRQGFGAVEVAAVVHGCTYPAGTCGVHVGHLRVTFVDELGPRGHSCVASPKYLHEYVADEWWPTSVRAVTEAQLDEWLKWRTKQLEDSL